ncbi:MULTISPECIES: ROK family transcriptional regulator [Kitasatospora]|uniref:Putative NagC family transcriptional regulator n=1 Tax=Kitasatospora setae (strain ATCC 33774 / DSM 43861 / JCM 3304 / KCC A-0304 / NBRC 14216 / KM-6054) TaxID=452652 RepID=E4NEU1_KITSK|nr:MULTISPECIES: ROK family transcriptional regulator [Kitasatospora]BAJ29877.1 putative NagC family transcriptional regulator [Kitasatospora setae KM-6054]
MTTRKPPRPPQAGTPSLLRAINDRAALELLLANGPLSRAQLGSLTGLSKPTASLLLARLEAVGLVMPVGTMAGRPGPNAQLYQVDPAAGHVAGLDVTSTGTRVAVADITGAVLAEHHVPTRGRPAAETVARTAEAVAEAVRRAGLAPGALREVVVGIGGAPDPVTGKLRYASHLPGWHSPRLAAELAEAVAAGVSFENDVNLAAVAEQAGGAAAGREDFVLLWAEEGIGAAVVLAGRPHRGFTGGAGEVGYMPVPDAPPVSLTARRTPSGGFQDLAGGPAVLALARKHGLPGTDAAQAVAGALTAPGGEGFLAELAERLAVGLAVIASVVDPELVVLSGGTLTAGGEPLRELVQDALGRTSIPRPEVRLSAVPGPPVLTGALQRALTTARDALFSTH